MRDFDMMSDERIEPRDKETMSLSACLNRIMIKVEQDTYIDSTVEELKADFDYVQQKMGLCPEEAAILSCVLENTHGFHSCDDEDIAKFMGCTNIEFIGFRQYLDSLAHKRLVRVNKGRGSFSYVILKEASQ